MDLELALVEVQAFRSDLGSYDNAMTSVAATGSDPHAAIRAQISRRIALIEDIASEASLAEPERIRDWNSLYRTSSAINAVDQLIGTLQSEERREQILGLTGPKLSASQMHRWVWIPAAELWDGGHRREAVQAAATSVFDTQLPAKLGVSRNTKPGDLISQAFTTDPPTGSKVRLRLPGFTQGDDDWTNAHQGAMYFGMGCVKAIRNIVTHTTEQPESDVALESLAALSLLARWIDDAEVESAPT